MYLQKLENGFLQFNRSFYFLQCYEGYINKDQPIGGWNSEDQSRDKNTLKHRNVP